MPNKGKSLCVPMCLFMGLDLETWVRNIYTDISITVLSIICNTYNFMFMYIRTLCPYITGHLYVK